MMNAFRSIICCILLTLVFTAEAQQFLLIENKKNLRNYKIYPGEDIRIRTSHDGLLIAGIVTALGDSSISINSIDEVPLSDVSAIYRYRIPVGWAQGLLLTGGVAYFSIDSFNRLINNQSPVILAETAFISLGMGAASAALIPLKYKRLRPDKWRMQVIDFSEMGGMP